MRTAALHNLGCKVNAYETDAMQALLSEAGYKIVSFNEQADVYVINTCSVTNIADRKSRQMIHQAKQRNPKACLVAAGCYVQTSLDKAKEDEAIDIIIGNNEKNKLIPLLEEFFKGSDKVLGYRDLTHEKDFEDMILPSTAEHTRAFIKVQDGCNQFCTYCIIPYARGRVRSRDLESCLNEIRALSDRGYKEVVLTGIHLSSYGIDIDSSLIELIEKVSMIKGIERIRLGSLEPGIVTRDFMERVSKIPSFCPHFHLSLQSGCDETLKRMNRRYTCDEYFDRCNLIREYYPHGAITTDVITGFPGETEEEFNATKEYLEKINLYEVHLFKYSIRQGTPAAKMKGQLTDRIKAERSHILELDQEKRRRAFREYYIGKTVDILFEEEDVIEGKIYYVGHTMDYVKVALPLCEGQDLSNRIVTVSVTDFLSEEALLARL